MDTPNVDAAREEILAHEACLRIDDATRKQAILRLKTVKGHLQGVLRMLEDESVYCVDVLKQVKAVTGALGVPIRLPG